MHQFPTIDPYFGLSPVGLAAGLFCGLVPLVVALVKGHVGAAFRCFGVCLFVGIFFGFLAAAGAALLMTPLILLEERLAAFKPKLPAWMTWTPLPFRSAPVSRTSSENQSDGVGLGEVMTAFGHCHSCGKDFVLALGASPPWCPACGADLKKQAAMATVVQPEAEIPRGL
jgi:hypothetical protein